MQLHSLLLDGITRFSGATHLDLSQIPPGLVAVTGPNGAGKSTIMESLLPATFFLEFPSRPGPMYGRASKRGATLELKHSYGGHLWRHLVQLDPGTGRSGASVQAFLERDGAPVPGWATPGRASDYEAAIAALFPSKAMILASVFAVGTGKGNFLELPRAEKRDLFTAMLGNQHLQDLSLRAAKHRSPLDAALIRLGDRGRMLEQDRQKIAEIRTRAEAARPAVDQARTATRAERARLTEAAAAATTARAQLATATAEQQRILQRRAHLEQQIRQAQQEMQQLQVQNSIDTATIKNAVAIEEAVKLRSLLEQQRAQLVQQYQATTAAAREASSARERAATTAWEAKRRIGAGEARLAELAGAAAELEGLQPDLVRLEEVQAKLNTAQQEVLAAREEQVRAEQRCPPAGQAESNLAAARAHLEHSTKTAELLQQVPCKGRKVYRFPGPDAEISEPEHMAPDEIDCGTCGFLANARAAEAGMEEARQRLQHAEAALGEAKALREEVKRLTTAALTAQGGVDILNREKTILAAKAIRATQITARLESRADVEHGLATDRAAMTQAEAEAEQYAGKAATALGEAEKARQDGTAVREQLDRVAATAAQELTLREAQVRLPLNQKAEQHADNRIREATAQLQQEPMPPSTTALAEAAAAAERTEAEVLAAVQRAEAEEQRAAGALSLLEGQLQAMGDLEERQKQLNEATTRIDTRRAAFRRIEVGMGRNGAQALEIDAAGPRVSDLTNTLLQATFDGRFSVALRTTRDSSDGKRQIEVFDIEVLDGQRGGIRQVEELSKGEKLLVDEALKLAIACFNAEKNGADMQTLFRDECDGALDPDKAALYPAMLRAALQIGRFRNVYFVSHRPEVVAQADAVIEITAGGSVTIRT